MNEMTPETTEIVNKTLAKLEEQNRRLAFVGSLVGVGLTPEGAREAMIQNGLAGVMLDLAETLWMSAEIAHKKRYGRTVPEVDIHDWARRLAEKYPEVSEVWLCGSRARGCHGPGSDYDVLVYLYDWYYEEDGVTAKDQCEQHIAFDPGFRFEHLDLFFLTPASAVKRWDWGPGEPPAEVVNEPEEFIRTCLLYGEPVGDFDRFRKDLPYALRLHPPADEDGAVE